MFHCEAPDRLLLTSHVWVDSVLLNSIIGWSLIRCDHGDISRQAHPIGAQMYVTSPFFFQLSSAHFKHARKARRKQQTRTLNVERWQIILCSCRSWLRKEVMRVFKGGPVLKPDRTESTTIMIDSLSFFNLNIWCFQLLKYEDLMLFLVFQRSKLNILFSTQSK